MRAQRRCNEQAATRIQAAVRRSSAVRQRWVRADLWKRAVAVLARCRRLRREAASMRQGIIWLQAAWRRRGAVRRVLEMRRVEDAAREAAAEAARRQQRFLAYGRQGRWLLARRRELLREGWTALLQAAERWRRALRQRRVAEAAAVTIQVRCRWRRMRRHKAELEDLAARQVQMALRRCWAVRRAQEGSNVRAALEMVEARVAKFEVDGACARADGMVVALAGQRTVGTDTELDTLLEKGVRLVRRSGGRQRRTARWRRQLAGEAAARAALWLEDAMRSDGVGWQAWRGGCVPGE